MKHLAIFLALFILSASGVSAKSPLFQYAFWHGVALSVSDTLAASPTSITLGGSSTLTWTSANATSCTGTNFSTGGLLNGSLSVTPSATTTYSISCAGPSGPAVANATVTVTGGSGNPDLNFAAATYSGGNCTTLSNCINDTRASAETCIDASGNVTYVTSGNPCITSAGIQSLSASSNIIEYSNALTTYPWQTFPSGSGSVSVNGTPVTSPDGTANAWAVTVNRTSNADAAFLYQTLVGSTAANYTSSIWIKGCTSGDVGKEISLLIGANSLATVQDTDFLIPSNTVWTQFSVRNFLLAGTNDQFILGYNGTSTQPQTGSVCFDAWSGQVEPGANATYPIPTTTASASRAADVIAISGSLASALDTSTGTVTVQTSRSTVLAAGELIDSNGTALLGKDQYGRATAALVNPINTLSAGWIAAQTETIAGLAWDGTGRSLIVNNYFLQKDSEAQTPSSTLYLGSHNGSNACDCAIAHVIAQASRVSDSTLAASTIPGTPVTGTTYYVSATGSDSNNGTSSGTPWQTFTKVSAHSWQPGDTLLVDAGNGAVACCASFSRSNDAATAVSPLTIDAYNGSVWAMTAPSAGGTSFAIDAVSGLVVKNSYFDGATCTGRYGFDVTNSGTSPMDNIVIKNNEGTGFCQPSSTTNQSACLEYEGYPGPQPISIANITYQNSSCHGTSPSSHDENGAWGFGNGENIVSFIADGDSVYNLGGKAGAVASIQANGFVFNGCLACVAQYILAHDIGYYNDVCGGPVGLWAAQSDAVLLQYSEIYNVQPNSFTSGCDWDGLDLDVGVTNSVVQYNYTHHNQGAGMLAFIGTYNYTWHDNVFRYNVSENDGLSGNGFFFCMSLAQDGSNARVDFYGNSCFNNYGSYAAGHFGGCISLQNYNSFSGHIINNLCQITPDNFGNYHPIFNGTTGLTLAAGQIDYNDYYSATGNMRILYNNTPYTTLAAFTAASGQDAHSNTNVPGWGSPPAGNCSWTPSLHNGPQSCPTAYQLVHGSAAEGAGANIAGSPYNLITGLRDYYGNAVPNGTTSGFNVGADNSTP